MNDSLSMMHNRLRAEKCKRELQSYSQHLNRENEKLIKYVNMLKDKFALISSKQRDPEHIAAGPSAANSSSCMDSFHATMDKEVRS